MIFMHIYYKKGSKYAEKRVFTHNYGSGEAKILQKEKNHAVFSPFFLI